jgi:predicted nucleic acid-binding protein
MSEPNGVRLTMQPTDRVHELEKEVKALEGQVRYAKEEYDFRENELENVIDLMFSWFATVNNCAPAQIQRDAFNKWRDESDEVAKASCLIGKDVDLILRNGRAVRERNALQEENAELKNKLEWIYKRNYIMRPRSYRDKISFEKFKENMEQERNARVGLRFRGDEG